MKKLFSTILSVALLSAFALASPAEAKHGNKGFNQGHCDKGKHLGWYKGNHYGWNKDHCNKGGNSGGWNGGHCNKGGHSAWNGGHCNKGGNSAWTNNAAFANRGFSKHDSKLNKKLAKQNATLTRK